jgi:serine phosphatase RsbU (regulator of sigma subunit)
VDDRILSISPDIDGTLWFGTLKGAIKYRRSVTPPKVYIISVTADQTYLDLSTIPAFTPGTRVTIEYDSIDFKTIPEKRQYRCRIQDFGKSLSKSEMDSDWRKPTKSNTFDFIFDSPGTYTFQVQAIDRDLNYSEPASVKLEVIPDPRNHRIIQLEEHIRQQELAEMERMQQELEDARQIQQSLLPESPPQVEGFEIAGTSLPAKEVSGDFYNYLSLGDRVGIVLADVTGKSVKAAMVAALADGMLSEEIKRGRELWNSPGMILKELNIGLQPRLIRGIFTAMSLGIIQPAERRLIFSNAGMPYPIVKRGREVWELEVNGLPLGITDSAEYDEMSVDLKSGDFVVFYSDGVIEATNPADEMYQTERLLEVVQKSKSSISAQEMVDLIVDDVTAFIGEEEAFDDITIVVLQCSD